MSKQVDGLLEFAATCPRGPNSHIDDSVIPRLRSLVGKPSSEQAKGLKEILDDCACCGLASDFAMVAMDAIWRLASTETE